MPSRSDDWTAYDKSTCGMMVLYLEVKQAYPTRYLLYRGLELLKQNQDSSGCVFHASKMDPNFTFFLFQGLYVRVVQYLKLQK